MLDIPNYFNCVLKNSSEDGWIRPKEVSEGLTQLLYPEAKIYLADTFYNQFFTKENKGSTLYKEVMNQIEEISYLTFIQQLAAKLKSINYRECKFDSEKTASDILAMINCAENITENIHNELIACYHLNKKGSLYLFLAESLYYALSSQNDKNTELIEPLALNKKELAQLLEDKQFILSTYLNKKELDATNVSSRFLNRLKQLEQEELALFMKLAELVIIDEDDYPYLYAPTTDEEQGLYAKYGIGNQEFLLLGECGLINLGTRIDNKMDLLEDDLCGFQNDNLVVIMHADKGTKASLSYQSYTFSTVGEQLLELVNIETNDAFFVELAASIKRTVEKESVYVGVYTVEDAEKIETIATIDKSEDLLK